LICCCKEYDLVFVLCNARHFLPVWLCDDERTRRGTFDTQIEKCTYLYTSYMFIRRVDTVVCVAVNEFFRPHESRGVRIFRVSVWKTWNWLAHRAVCARERTFIRVVL
jgi:hypothetical protein